MSFLNQLKSSSMVRLVSSEIKSILEHAMVCAGLEYIYIYIYIFPKQRQRVKVGVFTCLV